MTDALGDRMKLYEGMEGARFAMPGLPILARLDGKTFSGWTRGLTRPFDARLTALMVDTTRHLVEETCARVGYTQSDEISLLYWSDPKADPYLGGRFQKLASILASMATAYFNATARTAIPERADRAALFDCRVWTVPNRAEACNAFVWREFDATKNAISMAASEHYSHRELHEKTGAQKQEMLFQKGVNFNDYPAAFKRGTYLQRRTESIRFSAEELDRLPPKHHARLDPNLTVERHVVRAVEMPIITKVLNREAVLFDGAEPVTGEE